MTSESKILLDSPPELDATPITSFLERIDHPVELCHGPASGFICPILAGEGCEKVAQANGVIFHLDLDRAQHRDILEEYRATLSDDIPMRVVVQPGQDEKYAELLSGFHVWDHDPSVAELDGFAALVEAGDAGRA